MVAIDKLLQLHTAVAAVPIIPVTPESWQKKNGYNIFTSGLAETQNFTGRPGELLVVPRKGDGKPATVYAGIHSLDDMWALAKASLALPKGTYRIAETGNPLSAEQAHKVSVGWALAQYSHKVRNGIFKSEPEGRACLLVPNAARNPHAFRAIEDEVQATWKVRDLINMPANILNTCALAQEVLSLSREFNARARLYDENAVKKQFPLIHAVGRASDSPPALATIEWSGSDAGQGAPTVLLVGKGVPFDTGGVQVKPGDSMDGMKKDMGGAANAMGLARMIMSANLPLHLKLVVPIAENSISENAFRPSDVITARDGTDIEIGHTDAEGRLLLADALSYGVEKWNPDYIIDLATLTGAQRAADGTEVSGVWSNSKQDGRKIEDIGEGWNDDMQYHHLFEEKYGALLKSKIADINSSPRGGPGATIAALFLKHFIRAAKPSAKWLHIDMNGANTSSKPGRPAGGEAMGVRAAYRYLRSELGL